MSRKRRIFDIAMPSGPEAETFPAGKTEPEAEQAPPPKPARRGPMATAIGETADSTRERQELEARIRAENDALAHEHVRLKRLGLVMEMLPLDTVDASKLTRDRAAGADEELAELKASILALGLSNPIRVEVTSEGRYELIQGFRRLNAYRELLAETGDAARFATIPAAVAQPGDELETLYRRMVDENMVRKDISFAEMARLALDYAADPATRVSDPDKAVAELFHSAGYQKRSYIRNFIRVVSRIGDALSYPHEMPRALGLALSSRMEAEPGLGDEIRGALQRAMPANAEEELDILRQFTGKDPGAAPKVASEPRPAPRTGRAKTSFQFERREGRAKCTAANGRLEVRLDRDFSTVDRRKLEDAVRAMLDKLD